MSDRLLVTPVVQLCQMPAAMASSRWAMRVNTPVAVRPPWASRSSWPLRVWLTDSIHCRTPPRLAVGVGLVLAVRAQQRQSHLGGEGFEVLAGEALVGQQD